MMPRKQRGTAALPEHLYCLQIEGEPLMVHHGEVVILVAFTNEREAAQAAQHAGRAYGVDEVLLYEMYTMKIYEFCKEANVALTLDPQVDEHGMRITKDVMRLTDCAEQYPPGSRRTAANCLLHRENGNDRS